MAPTEDSILRSFLLQKASLRDMVTLAEFTSYFPSSKRSNPLIRQLFRDIQTQRTSVCESVLKQINLECRMGDNLIAKKRAERESQTKSTGDKEDPEVISLISNLRTVLTVVI
jgi:Cnl2/NKP2 family protein